MKKQKSDYMAGTWSAEPYPEDHRLSHVLAHANNGAPTPIYLAGEMRTGNAERVVACVNACAGIANPEALPELLAACDAYLECRKRNKIHGMGEPDGVKEIRLSLEALKSGERVKDDVPYFVNDLAVFQKVHGGVRALWSVEGLYEWGERVADADFNADAFATLAYTATDFDNPDVYYQRQQTEEVAAIIGGAL